MSAPVTVAVVSWNTRELLARCLRSLSADAEAARVAVWVCDNASSDGSAEMVRADFPWVSLIDSTENLGFGPAVNEVAKRTTSPWLAPANADVEITPGAIEALVAVGADDSRAGIVAPRLLMQDGSTQHSVHPFPSIPVASVLALGLPRLSARLGDRLCLEGHWNPDRPRRLPWAHGAFLLVRRSAFDQAGGFDPGQWLYAEDLDLAWRLARRGWHVRYEPRSAIRHAVSAATSKAFGETREATHWAAAYSWMIRRRGIVTARGYAAVNLAGVALRLAIFAPLAIGSPKRFRKRRDRAIRWVRLHRIGFRSRAALQAGPSAADRPTFEPPARLT